MRGTSCAKDGAAASGFDSRPLPILPVYIVGDPYRALRFLESVAFCASWMLEPGPLIHHERSSRDQVAILCNLSASLPSLELGQRAQRGQTVAVDVPPAKAASVQVIPE